MAKKMEKASLYVQQARTMLDESHEHVNYFRRTLRANPTVPGLDAKKEQLKMWDTRMSELCIHISGLLREFHQSDNQTQDELDAMYSILCQMHELVQKERNLTGYTMPDEFYR